MTKVIKKAFGNYPKAFFMNTLKFLASENLVLIPIINLYKPLVRFTSNA